MHRLLAEHVALPILFRRSWPRLRSQLAIIRAAEGATPRATRDTWERRAVAAARTAAERTSYYRGLYGPQPTIETIDDFRRLPVVTKDAMRAHVEEMLHDGAERSSMQRGATGGSTGVPTPYYHCDAWWARASAAALRGDEWAGWRIGDPNATLWGTPLSETVKAKVLRLVGEHARNQTFLPSFDLSVANLDRNIDRLVRARPVLVTGYASVLVAHARRIAERGIEFPSPRSVISSAETLRPEMRELVEQSFGASVYDRYGCRELGLIAQECSVHDGLHIASEHVYVEVDVDGRPARPGETGRVLVTLLGDLPFPFVRYEVGDAAVAAADEPCLCGVPFPKLARVEGRLLEVLHKADGGSLSGTFFPHLMKEFPFVREFQVVQDEEGAVEIRIVPEGARPADAAVAPIVRETRNVLGDLPVRVSLVASLERTPSGKVRVTQSRWRPSTAGAGATAGTHL
ncbi:MAG: phenylacetate--CoA ligase family protein [Planctomycetes bacterium]|nr:phenylacetate--CoA ligase family protein [Planctomycetota bacterium]